MLLKANFRMSSIFTTAVVIICIGQATAQNNVGIGTNTPDASAILELLATNKGILIPRTDTTLVPAPATGLLIYQNADSGFYYFDGAKWMAALGPVGPTGAPGTNGTNGTDGATGPTGATGAPGTNGTNGTDGATGPTGAPGTNGTNGTDGATGPTGPAGAGTLQGAYDGGNTISTTAARPIAFTINSTNSPFTVTGTNANMRVGFGTTTPAANLHFVRTGTIGEWETQWDNNGGVDAVMRVQNTSTANSNRVFLGVTSYDGSAFNTPGIEGLAVATTGTGHGVQGSSNSPDGIGVRGTNTAAGGAGAGYGVRGETSQTGGTGVFGDNFNAAGTGVAGNGNNVTPQVPAAGAGGAFTGDVNGAFAKFNNAGTAQALLLQDNFGAQWQVGYYDAAITTYRKIEGTGSVNTVVKDIDGNRVVLSAPEAPENLFEDYGTGQLINGFAQIEIDPNFAKNITINNKHPLRVFIQLEGDCKGVYVTNKTQNSFDVMELNGGKSNTAFMYHIIGNRADEVMDSGRIARYADLRFAPAAKIQEVKDLNRGTKNEGPTDSGYKSQPNSDKK